MTPITSRDLNRFLVFLNRKRSQFRAARLAGSDLTGPMYSFLLCLEKTPGIRQDFSAHISAWIKVPSPALQTDGAPRLIAVWSARMIGALISCR